MLDFDDVNQVKANINDMNDIDEVKEQLRQVNNYIWFCVCVRLEMWNRHVMK